LIAIPGADTGLQFRRPYAGKTPIHLDGSRFCDIDGCGLGAK